MSWDDLRYVLAVADHGSVSAAARKLGVTHATVLRRVASFEAAHGGQVFDRNATGYLVRDDRQNVIQAAREVAEAVGTVDRLMHGVQAPVRGLVRLSSTDSFCRYVLPRMVQDLLHVAPDLRLELLSSNQHVDIGRLQADITVRPAATLPGDMAGEVGAQLFFFAYSRDADTRTWLGLRGPLARSSPGQWIQETIPEERIAGGSDSFVVLSELARLGLGISVLPAFLGDIVPGLTRRPSLMPEISVPVWTATHVDLADSPRIRLARRHITDYLNSCAPVLAGQA